MRCVDRDALHLEPCRDGLFEQPGHPSGVRRLDHLGQQRRGPVDVASRPAAEQCDGEVVPATRRPSRGAHRFVFGKCSLVERHRLVVLSQAVCREAEETGERPVIALRAEDHPVDLTSIVGAHPFPQFDEQIGAPGDRSDLRQDAHGVAPQHVVGDGVVAPADDLFDDANSFVELADLAEGLGQPSRPGRNVGGISDDAAGGSLEGLEPTQLPVHRGERDADVGELRTGARRARHLYRLQDQALGLVIVGVDRGAAASAVHAVHQLGRDRASARRRPRTRRLARRSRRAAG